jgi:hypothetical protein
MPFVHPVLRAPIAGLSAGVVLFAASDGFAQCGAMGCSTSAVPAYTQPAFTPSLGQDMLLEARKAASEAWQPELPVPKSSGMDGLPSASASVGLAAPAASNAVRSWTNGDGQWMSSPTGAACQVSSRGNLGSSSPCTDGF